MLVAIHRHKPLVEGSAPNPLVNTEFHSVAARLVQCVYDVMIYKIIVAGGCRIPMENTRQISGSKNIYAD